MCENRGVIQNDDVKKEWHLVSQRENCLSTGPIKVLISVTVSLSSLPDVLANLYHRHAGDILCGRLAKSF